MPPGTLETSGQHVRLRVIKKKKIIVKKRKKQRQPGPLVTASPLVTTNPAKTPTLPEKQEPGIDCLFRRALPSVGTCQARLLSCPGYPLTLILSPSSVITPGCPPLGLESLRVSDSQLEASSSQSFGLGPHRGRLNIQVNTLKSSFSPLILALVCWPSWLGDHDLLSTVRSGGWRSV